MTVETYAFQAEINQLLSLIIHAFYSNKDIFLRELVSNASDAIDKIRYQSLTQTSVLDSNPTELSIRILPDKAAKTLTLQDNGIGMTKQDLVSNLGTIARSGTKAFVEALGAGVGEMTQLIGQFGVGFYAAYLVSDSVAVITKHNEDAQTWVWESSASGSFTVRAATDSEATLLEGRGTRVVLSLKEDQLHYLDTETLRSIIKQHCEFIAYPIKLLVEKEEESIVTEAEDVDGAVEDANETEPTTRKVKTQQLETLNKQKPIWMKPANEVTEEEYNAFFKVLSNSWENHLAVKHVSVEGQLAYRAILFVPRSAPYDLFDKKVGSHGNIKLYVRRIFITDSATVRDSSDSDPDAHSFLLPEYLNFVIGVVDSDDMPLNISREMLQQNKILKVIKKNLVKKVLDLLTDMLHDKPEDYKTFYKNFQKNIKLGVHEDTMNRDKLMEMLMYSTTKTTGDEMVSLKQYVQRMKETQKSIYYITGENRSAIEHSPFLQKLKQRGYEVLLMTDPIDEYVMQRVRDYKEKPFVCCTKDGFKLEEEEDNTEQKQKLEETFKPVCEKIKSILGDKVIKVSLSDRMVDTPCVLVTEQYGWSANMERLMRAQALQGGGAANPFMMMGSRKILEINPSHPLIVHIQSMVDDSSQAKTVENIVELLFESTLIHSGFTLEDPTRYTSRIFRMMQAGLGIEADVSPGEGEVEPTCTDAGKETSMEELD